MQAAIAVLWDIYMQCGRHICYGAYVSDVKRVYTSTCGDTVDCIEFMSHIY